MKHAHFCIRCTRCRATTSKAYAYKHDDLCKACFEADLPSDPAVRAQAEARATNHASHEEQQARYIDCGPAAWDDR